MNLQRDSFRCATMPLELYSINYMGHFRLIDIQGKWQGWKCSIQIYLDAEHNPRSRSQSLVSAIFLSVKDNKFWRDEEALKVSRSVLKQEELWRGFQAFIEPRIMDKRSPEQIMAVLESFKVG